MARKRGLEKTEIRPGDRAFLDGRYKKPVDMVDKGAMSHLKLVLPIKPPEKVIRDDRPKQLVRHLLAKLRSSKKRKPKF